MIERSCTQAVEYCDFICIELMYIIMTTASPERSLPSKNIGGFHITQVCYNYNMIFSALIKFDVREGGPRLAVLLK